MQNDFNLKKFKIEKQMSSENKNNIIDIYNEESGEISPFNMVDNIIFSEPEEGKLPQANPNAIPISFYRIYIKHKNGDDVIMKIGPCYTFGVSENFSQETKELTGYQMPLVMFDRDGASDYQKSVVEHLDQLSAMGKKAVISYKKQIKKGDLQESDVRNMNILYRYKDENGLYIQDKSPVLYCKLISSKKKGMKILTNFTLMDIVNGNCKIVKNEKNEPIELDPKKLIGVAGMAEVYVKLESIFIGSKMTYQIKAWDVYYKPMTFKLTKLKNMSEKNTILITNENNPAKALMMASEKKDENVNEKPQEEAKLPETLTKSPEKSNDSKIRVVRRR